MTTEQSNKDRVLWVTEKPFDTDLDTATWVEMVTCLQERCAVQLLADYRHKEVQPKAFHNRIIYYGSSNVRYVRRFSRYLSQYRVFRSVLASFRPTIILFDGGNLPLFRYAVRLKARGNLRLFFDVRTLPVESNAARNWLNGTLLASCLRYAAKHFDGISYITTPMQQHCIDEYRLPPHPSVVWTSGVNPDLFAPPPQGTSASGPFTVLYHGTIARQRRIDNAVRAMSLLKDLDIRLVLLGSGDGLDDLRQLACDLGVQGRVSINGPVDYEEVPKWIGRSHAGILPFQDWDGWNVSSPIKLFEYLACGKPVVVTDIPAHRQVLKEADWAFWASQSSPQDIAAALRQAYQARADFHRLGAEARQLVLSEYTWARQAEKLYRFLEGERGL
jgi:glycosyltransferase involved in cell wall biosynthesis